MNTSAISVIAEKIAPSAEKQSAKTAIQNIARSVTSRFVMTAQKLTNVATMKKNEMQSIIVYGLTSREMSENIKVLKDHFKTVNPIVIAFDSSTTELFPDDHLILATYTPTIAERRFKTGITMFSATRMRQILGYRWTLSYGTK